MMEQWNCLYTANQLIRTNISSLTDTINIGIKHGFSCINIRQVPWEVLKTEADHYYCIKEFATFRIIFCLFTDVSRT